MRRAQSVRHYARPSLALAADDLGMLREGAETDEDVLRRQLIEKDRECDRLNAQVQTLQAQLAQRPPIEDIQEMQKEYKNLELILQGTQRENERCMSELERGRQREKLLERKLCELAGENWQSSLELPPSSAIGLGGRSGPVHGHQRSHTISSSPLAPKTLSGFYNRQPSSPSPNGSTQSSQDQSSSSSSDLSHSADPQAAAHRQQALFAHIEQVKLLVLGMEQRLQTREDKLVKTVEKAERESQRFEVLGKDAGIAVDG